MTLYGGVSFLDNQGPFDPKQLALSNLSERAPDQDELMRRNNDKLAREMRVSIPASVVSFDPVKQTIVAQPLIREKVVNRQTGETGFVTLPQLVDVPVVFPRGGVWAFTVPITAGDEVLIVFADTNIDSWYANGGIQNWNDRRRHDLSDAIAIPGVYSQPNVLTNFNETDAEIRNEAGDIKIALNSAALTAKYRNAQVILNNSSTNILFANDTPSLTNSISITSSQITFNWRSTNFITLNSSGINVTGNLRINGAQYALHTHAVTTAPGTTGPVN
jgi:hypothetical protein